VGPNYTQVPVSLIGLGQAKLIWAGKTWTKYWK